MVRRVEQDHFRFREIVRGKIKEGLRKYISKGEIMGRVGKKTVSVPVPQIELPHFQFDPGKEDGVGSGEGEPGDPVDGQPQEGEGAGEAGEGEGQHALEVEVELEELAKILGEELELPNIQPKGVAEVESSHDKYTGIRSVGPESLRHMKRTYKRALRRQISQGNYDVNDPKIIPIREDRRYRAWKVEKKPEYSAAIIYMMDVSGSMGAEQKEIVRITAFWIDLWLKHQYKNLNTVYIVHDAAAKEVDQHTFFHLRESGGTKISSAYRLCLEIIEERFGSEEWNIYPFHFSDGDNWSGKDSAECVKLLRDQIIPVSNQFSYGQVKSAYGSGQFKRDLDQHFEGKEPIITSGINDRNGILDAIKDFLGEGAMKLNPELSRWQELIEGHARDYGLDFFETRFEILSYDELNEVASFGGFPTRYPHWRFGMSYEQLSKGYEWGSSKIYELVINNDPCYAYLMSSNPMVDQKLVMAHVYGHCDFFKNNYYFSFTNRKMMDEMANHATKIRRMVDSIGLERVEDFLDLALSIENLIDHMAPYLLRTGERKDPVVGEAEEQPARIPSKSYMETFINPPEFVAAQKEKLEKKKEQEKRATPEPIRDVLSFLIENSPLEDWQVEILEIVRSEAYYFNPQGMTKIMNEGWASYWHQKIMTANVLNDSEVVDYAETMASVISSTGPSLNPYALGLALLHDIEERWNTGRHGLEWERIDDERLRREFDNGEMLGREKIFEVRRHHNDVTFIDSFLTEGFCHRHKLFVYAWNPRTGRKEIATRDFAAVKEQLLRQLVNGGHPVIEVVDSNHANRGELYLMHRWDQNDLRDDYARATLQNVARIWSRPVLLETQIGGRRAVYRSDGDEVELEEES